MFGKSKVSRFVEAEDITPGPGYYNSSKDLAEEIQGLGALHSTTARFSTDVLTGSLDTCSISSLPVRSSRSPSKLERKAKTCKEDPVFRKMAIDLDEAQKKLAIKQKENLQLTKKVELLTTERDGLVKGEREFRQRCERQAAELKRIQKEINGYQETNISMEEVLKEKKKVDAELQQSHEESRLAHQETKTLLKQVEELKLLNSKIKEESKQRLASLETELKNAEMLAQNQLLSKEVGLKKLQEEHTNQLNILQELWELLRLKNDTLSLQLLKYQHCLEPQLMILSEANDLLHEQVHKVSELEFLRATLREKEIEISEQMTEHKGKMQGLEEKLAESKKEIAELSILKDCNHLALQQLQQTIEKKHSEMLETEEGFQDILHRLEARLHSSAEINVTLGSQVENLQKTLNNYQDENLKLLLELCDLKFQAIEAVDEVQSQRRMDSLAAASNYDDMNRGHEQELKMVVESFRIDQDLLHLSLQDLALDLDACEEHSFWQNLSNNSELSTMNQKLLNLHCAHLKDLSRISKQAESIQENKTEVSALKETLKVQSALILFSESKCTDALVSLEKSKQECTVLENQIDSLETSLFSQEAENIQLQDLLVSQNMNALEAVHVAIASHLEDLSLQKSKVDDVYYEMAQEIEKTKMIEEFKADKCLASTQELLLFLDSTIEELSSDKQSSEAEVDLMNQQLVHYLSRSILAKVEKEKLHRAIVLMSEEKQREQTEFTSREELLQSQLQAAVDENHDLLLKNQKLTKKLVDESESIENLNKKIGAIEAEKFAVEKKLEEATQNLSLIGEMDFLQAQNLQLDNANADLTSKLQAASEEIISLQALQEGYKEREKEVQEMKNKLMRVANIEIDLQVTMEAEERAQLESHLAHRALENLIAENAMLAGHKNHHQKIQHLKSVKQKNIELETQVGILDAQLRKVTQQLLEQSAVAPYPTIETPAALSGSVLKTRQNVEMNRSVGRSKDEPLVGLGKKKRPNNESLHSGTQQSSILML